MPEILVVAATVPELSGLPPDVRRSAIGIGDIDAACGVAAVLAIGTSRGVLLVGTCGAYGLELELDQVIVVEQAVRPQRAPGIAVPPQIARSQAADAGLVEKIAGALSIRRVTCASGRGVTIDDEEASLAGAETGALVENPECFAALRACARANVPATALLAVAYRAGAGALEEAQEHRSMAEAHAIAAVARALAHV